VDVTKNANADSGIISDVITGKGGGLVSIFQNNAAARDRLLLCSYRLQSFTDHLEQVR
jgi:hypothetical protein